MSRNRREGRYLGRYAGANHRQHGHQGKPCALLAFMASDDISMRRSLRRSVLYVSQPDLMRLHARMMDTVRRVTLQKGPA